MNLQLLSLLLLAVARSVWSQEYLWSTKVDGDPNWGMYEVKPVSADARSDGSVRMIVEFNSDPTYVYKKESDDVAATLRLGENLETRTAFLHFSTNGTLLQSIPFDFKPSVCSVYHWTNDSVYAFNSWGTAPMTLNFGVNASVTLLPNYLWSPSFMYISGVYIHEMQSYNLFTLSNKIGTGLVDSQGRAIWLYYAENMGVTTTCVTDPRMFYGKLNYYIVSGYWSGNRIPVKNLNGDQVAVMVNYGTDNKFIWLVNTNGSFMWSVTGPYIVGDIQNDGSVIITSASSNGNFTINLNNVGSNVTRFTSALGDECVQVWPNGTMASVKFLKKNELVLRTSAGSTRLINGDYASPVLSSQVGKNVVKYSASNGTELLERKINYLTSDTSATYRPLSFISETGLFVLSGMFTREAELLGKNGSILDAKYTSNGYTAMFVAVYDLFGLNGIDRPSNDSINSTRSISTEHVTTTSNTNYTTIASINSTVQSYNMTTYVADLITTPCTAFYAQNTTLATNYSVTQPYNMTTYVTGQITTPFTALLTQNATLQTNYSVTQPYNMTTYVAGQITTPFTALLTQNATLQTNYFVTQPYNMTTYVADVITTPLTELQSQNNTLESNYTTMQSENLTSSAFDVVTRSSTSSQTAETHDVSGVTSEKLPTSDFASQTTIFLETDISSTSSLTSETTATLQQQTIPVFSRERYSELLSSQNLWFSLAVAVIAMFGLTIIVLTVVCYKYSRKVQRLELVSNKLKDLQRQLDSSRPPPFEEAINDSISRPTRARLSQSSTTSPTSPTYDSAFPTNPFRSQYNRPAPPPPPPRRERRVTNLLD
ncbi:hypothetical protein MP638_000732 [Amoeboaphelidium occidentale]|nr:hypothetical protein MP638_000732 [Amoeboaphelidium occidentale]